ncbi:potential polyamine N-acetyl transferase [Pseudozyma hubeiensis SY62]|uniref:Potential polyamine N-acetyl transferase n=1 Tax=Pseudozyma hubeiensis (strain SY62) TaxID=1305764 RepID=R9P617_PSEHS|nr:potential polyamine N-acetyl transferase [Pseudozyma hubeiensis SY62]GAC96697.1 potential polyamine N-acetyl transferase [Pseudozyma hubeiensis SY62]
MAHNSTTLYQTITNTLGRTNTRSNSSSSSASNMSQSSQRSPPPSSHKRTSSLHKTNSTSFATSSLPRNLIFDYVRPEEVRAAHALEVEGYPPEDAASYERLLSRQTAAPHLFLGAFVPMPPPKVAGPLSVSGQPRRRIVGFITGTAAPALTLRSMSTHDTSEDARIVCIHSVCVAPEMQRKGLATRMLENYISRVRKAEEGKGPEGDKGKRGYETLALLAHEELTGLYKKVGFRIQCVSHIQYGSGQWLEMRRSVYPSPSSGNGSRIGAQLTRTTSATSSASDDTPAGLKMSSGFLAPIDTTQPLKPDATTSAVSTITIEDKKPPALSDAKSISASPTLASPPGMPSQASIMAALAAQSQPGKSPGQTYTSILGQAVAAKTPAEDAGMALEARLVDRESGTNLARLYCPMDNCRCCILAKGAGEWARKESGPLSNPALQLPNSPSPPQAPAFPLHAASAGVSNRLLTSVKGFWMVAGPLQFDNVGFSRDLTWTVPLGNDPTSPKATSDQASGLNVESPASPRTKAQEKEARDRQKKEEKERLREEKEKRKKEKRDRKRPGSGSDESDEDVASLLSHLSLGLTPGEEVTVKYLLCPDCECGPLGFTILPAEMQGGRLAAEVGDEVERRKGGTMTPSESKPKRPPQVFYLAADRVRYQFERS